MSEIYKNIVVTGTPNAVASVVLKNAAGQTYNTQTKSFDSGSNIIKLTLEANGRAVFPVVLPSATSNDSYFIDTKATPGVSKSRDLVFKEAIEKPVFKDYIDRTLTFTTSHTVSGYSIGSGLSTTFVSNTSSEPTFNVDDLEDGSVFSVSGAITKSSALLYVTRQPSISKLAGGDFTNSQTAQQLVEAFKPNLVQLDSGTNLINGMHVFGNNINEEITTALDGSTVGLVGLTSFPRFDIGQTLYFSMGGYDTDITKASITGSGTNSLTATLTGSLNKTGFTDQTITWRLQENVTTVPNASAISATCILTETVAINCGAGDTDANAGSKTYTRVAGPSKGVVGNNSTAFDNNTFTGSTITYKNSTGEGTDTFTYKCNDGTTDSATKTVTITLTE